MNAVMLRRPVMQYRDQEFRYESEGDELDTESVRQQTDGKQYRSKRSSKASSSPSAEGNSSRPRHRPVGEIAAGPGRQCIDCG